MDERKQEEKLNKTSGSDSWALFLEGITYVLKST